MKHTLLIITLLASFLFGHSQEWIESNGFKANFVRGSYVTNDQSAIITTAIGKSHVSYDQGETWSDILGPDGQPFVSSYFAEADGQLHNIRVNEGWGTVIIHSSSDNGQSWSLTAEEQLFEPWAFYSESVHVFDDQLYISMDDTLIITSPDLQDPTFVYPGFPGFFPSQGFSKMVRHQGNIYALGPQFAGIRRSTDNGLTWDEPPFNILSGYIKHITTDNGKLYISDDEHILEFDDDTETWTDLGASNSWGWTISEFFVEGDRIITRGESAHLHISEDHGASWSVIESFENFGLPNTSLAYENIASIDRVADHYVVGGFFGTMTADVSDLEFESALTGHTGETGLHDLVVIGDQQLGITGENMKFSSALGNGTWTYLGADIIGNPGSNITAYRSSLIRDGETVYSSTGHLLRSEDMGQSWDTLYDASVFWEPQGYMDMGFSENHIFLGTTLGPLRSADDGVTWENFADNQNRTEALCYKDGELFFADGFGEGEIYYSTDNGDTYSSVKGNLQGKVKDIKVAGGSVFVVSSTASWSTQNDIWVMDGRDGVWVQVNQFVTETNDGSYFDMYECDNALFVATRNGQYVTEDAGATWTDITYNLNTLAPNIDVLPREWANDTLYCTGQFKIYKLPFEKNATGISDLRANISFDLYPNPATDMIKINSSSPILSFEILDASGRVIRSMNGWQTEGLEVSDLHTGMYLLRLMTADGLTSKTFYKE